MPSRKRPTDADLRKAADTIALYAIRHASARALDINTRPILGQLRDGESLVWAWRWAPRSTR